MKKHLLSVSIIALITFAAKEMRADVSFSGSYSQNFDALANSGTTAAWLNDSTITGWYLYGYAGTTVPTYRPAAGGGASDNTGSFYSYGAAASTERAIGGAASSGTYFGSPGPGSGAIAGYIAVAIQNTSGGTFDSFTVSFDGEQWRNGGNATAQTMQLQYGFGATFATVSAWNSPGGTFDWASPVASATAAGVDGNSTGLVASRGGTISSLTWNDSEKLWIRWVENNDVGNDHGLAIDNFTLTATSSPVPEPSAMAIVGGFGMLALFMAARRRN